MQISGPVSLCNRNWAQKPLICGNKKNARTPSFLIIKSLKCSIHKTQKVPQTNQFIKSPSVKPVQGGQRAIQSCLSLPIRDDHAAGPGVPPHPTQHKTGTQRWLIAPTTSSLHGLTAPQRKEKALILLMVKLCSCLYIGT